MDDMTVLTGKVGLLAEGLGVHHLYQHHHEVNSIAAVVRVEPVCQGIEEIEHNCARQLVDVLTSEAHSWGERLQHCDEREVLKNVLVLGKIWCRD